MSVTIYHNPRCSKSRQTLAILEEKKVDHDVVEYLSAPPSKAELKRIIGMLGVKPAEIVRKKEAREAGLNDPDMDDDALIEAMAANPIVIERPIVVNNGKAALGRPPESVVDIL